MVRLNARRLRLDPEVTQQRRVDIGGYFRPNPDLASKAMRPSPTLNAIVDAIA